MRRLNRRKQKVKEKQKPLFFKFVFVIVLTILAIASVVVFFKVSNLKKFSFVNHTSDNGGEIVLLDPGEDKIIKYKIEPETVFESSRGLGEYKLSSLWILGEKEKYDGKLVAETVTSNYLIPVYYWKNGEETNLNLFQRIKLMFSNTGSNYEKTLDSTDLSNSILINFLNNDIQEAGISIEVNDLTGDQEVINKVSKILGTMGSKISNYTKGYSKEIDCEISGKNVEMVTSISNVFDCKISNENLSETADVTLKLGVLFADRF